MRRPSKAKAQRRHARRRGAERFGLLPDLRRLTQEIRSGRAEFLRRQSLRVTLWRVEVAGEKAIAVYDKKRGQVVTLWPDE